MKFALFADIHSNLQAITACLDHAKALGADRYAFLGDLVGYGADPVAVVDLIANYAADGAIVVLGNHDAAALGQDANLSGNARHAIVWTQDQLGEKQRAFLASLPLMVREDPIVFVHASAAAPERWIYITGPTEAEQSMRAAAANFVFSGHVHQQQLYYATGEGRPMSLTPVAGTPIPMARNHRWLAIVGSAGQPRDHSNAACYALADLERSRLTFYRVAYDYRSAAQKVRAAGLPERLALRLEKGA